MAAGVAYGEVALFADVGDGPAVAVFDPVGGGESESAVVAAGDDHVADTGLIAVGQGHVGCRLEVIKTVGPGAAVELEDELAGGGDHDRVEPGRSVGYPSSEGILRGGGEVADMNTAVVKVEVERCRFAFAEGE